MTFEQAFKIKTELNEGVSSKTYRVIPNPKTDSEGYKKFMADLGKYRNLSDNDVKKYSTNLDFEVLEEQKGITTNN